MLKASSLPPDWCFPDRISKDQDSSRDQDRSSVRDDSSPPNAARVALRRLSDIGDEPVEWAWEGVFPRGELTLIAGPAGIGKSRLILGIVAAMTRGLLGPNDQSFSAVNHYSENCCGNQSVDVAQRANDFPTQDPSCDAHEPPVAGAVWFCSGSDLVDMVRPRLIEARARMSSIYVLCGVDDGAEWQGDCLDEQEAEEFEEGSAESELFVRRTRVASFQLHRDLPVLQAEMLRLWQEGVDVRMIVIDPINCVVDSTLRRLELEADIAKLVALAARFRVAIVAAVRSSPQEITGQKRWRGVASIEALKVAARAIWVVVRDLDNSDRRFLLPVKASLAMKRTGLAYSVVNGEIAWESERVPLSGEDYIAETMQVRHPLTREYQFERDRAAAWLYERLRAGRVPATEVQKDASLNEISERTLRRAFQSLACVSCRESGKNGEGKWYWRLPGKGFFNRAGAQRFPDQDGQPCQVGHLEDIPKK